MVDKAETDMTNCWEPEDLKSIIERIELAREQPSGCLIADAMEALEILEQLQWILQGAPSLQKQYFAEAVDELASLIIRCMECLRTNLNFG